MSTLADGSLTVHENITRNLMKYVLGNEQEDFFINIRGTTIRYLDSMAYEDDNGIKSFEGYIDIHDCTKMKLVLDANNSYLYDSFNEVILMELSEVYGRRHEKKSNVKCWICLRHIEKSKNLKKKRKNTVGYAYNKGYVNEVLTAYVYRFILLGIPLDTKTIIDTIREEMNSQDKKNTPYDMDYKVNTEYMKLDWHVRFNPNVLECIVSNEYDAVKIVNELIKNIVHNANNEYNKNILLEHMKEDGNIVSLYCDGINNLDGSKWDLYINVNIKYDN